MRRLAALLLSIALSTAAYAADATKPHAHQGVLAAYKGAPPVPSLTADDLATLAAGQPVLKQQKMDDSSGRGIAVQDIHAEPAVIWSKITNYAKYPEWVDGVYECEVYERSGDRIRARFVIGAMMMKVEYFIDHVWRPDQGYMTWTLDYARTSDLDDSVGFWRVEPLADKPGWSRVYYSVAVKLNGWVPGWVEDMLSKKGLTQATGWVKRESES